MVTGYGLIDGRRVCIFSQDPTIFDGQIGEVYADKILKIYDLAMKTGVPLIGIYDSTGPRWKEGIVTAHMQAQILRAATRASGLIPQIAVVAGDAAALRGRDVLVAGGAGAVGSTVAQIGKVLGLHVVASAGSAAMPMRATQAMSGSSSS